MVDKEKTAANIYKIVVNNYASVLNCSVLMGVSLMSVYRWIEGKAFPKIDHLVMLADKAGVTVDDILVREEE